jgi:hypothetical protein
MAWATVAGWVATVGVFVAWVWFRAPVRCMSAYRPVRVAAWCLLLPVVWWCARAAVRLGWLVLRWLFAPVVAVLWSRVSGRSDVRRAVKAIRKGRKRGRRNGKRIARTIYGASAARA